MKILITGGSGFLGSHVADELSKKGHQVVIYDKKKSKWKRKNQNIFVGNILDYNKTKKAIKGAKVVFHLAALSDLEDAMHKPLETVKNNILGTVNILELSRKHKIKRIIYASSIYSMSSQGSFYRCSKKAAEDYIEEYYKRFGLNFTVIRYGSLYGLRTNRSNGVFRIIDDALENKKIQYVGNRNSIRRYIHVVDAARATVESMSSKYKNKYVNIVGTKFYKVTELLAIISKSLKISEKVQFLNVKMMGHYIKFPKLFRLRKGMNYKLKNHIKFKYGINSLIQNMKKTRKTIN
tara:strand:+ start:1626 stop:2504 length:879 start_codon:yes stop_codon:yes gene_type:complete